MEFEVESGPGFDPGQSEWQTFEEHKEALFRVIDDQRTNGFDEYACAFFSFLHDKLQTSTELNEIVSRYLKANPDDMLDISIRKLYSSFQQFFIPLPRGHAIRDEDAHLRDPEFPVGYDQPEMWQQKADLILNDERQNMRLRVALITKELQSNVLSRFTPPRVTAQLFGLNPVNIYAGGASFGIIEKMEKLYAPGRLRMPGTVSVGWLLRGDVLEFQSDDSLTGDYCALLNAPYKVNRIIASDIDPPTDPLSASLAYSNCFRGTELANRRYKQMVDRMIMKRVLNMRFTKGDSLGDYTSKDHVMHMRRRFPEWFELPNRKVQLITTCNINTEDQNKRAEENMQLLAGDDGLVLYMDFMHQDAEGNLHYKHKSSRWEPWDYNLSVDDMQNQTVGKQHIFSIRDGRASVLAPGEALKQKMAQNGGRLTIGMMREAPLAA